MTASVYDFRQPPPGDLERQTRAWLVHASRKAAAAWGVHLGYSAKLEVQSVELMSARAGRGRLPADVVGYPISTADPADGTAFLALTRPFLLALLGGLVGDPPTELPADRDLTDLESSLTDYLARTLVLDPMESAWSGDETLRLTAGSVVPAGAIRPGPAGEMALFATLAASTPFGEQTIHILIPRGGIWERGSSPARAALPIATTNRQQIAELVEEMPVELTVVLGTAELTMADVAGLRAGDLVVLGQRVGEPLDGLVAGAKKFRVWPGAMGSRAAVQVHTSPKG